MVGDTLLAVLSNGQLLATERVTPSWCLILAEAAGVRCAIAVQA